MTGGEEAGEPVTKGHLDLVVGPIKESVGGVQKNVTDLTKRVDGLIDRLFLGLVIVVVSQLVIQLVTRPDLSSVNRRLASLEGGLGPGGESGELVDAGLDYAEYVDTVEPLLVEAGVSGASCAQCHAEQPDRFLVFFDEGFEGAETWTAGQSRRNFEAVSRFVVPGEPDNSPLLTRPLSGGEDHAGGRQLSEQDELYRALVAWIQGAGGRG